MFSSKIYLLALCLVGILAHAKAIRYESGEINHVFPEQGTESVGITVQDDFTICDVNIEVDISHTYGVEELVIDVSLVVEGDSPVQVVLADDDCLVDDLHVVFDDESSVAIDSSGPVVSAACTDPGISVQPEGTLSSFDGHSSRGDWTLTVTDVGSGDSATLHEWAVILTPCDDNSDGAGTGDPHFKTWAGKWFDFHGECDMVFISNPKFDQGTGLEIHIRTKARYQYSYIESAAIQIGEDILEVGAYGGYMLNGISNAELDMIDKYAVTHEKVGSKQDVFVVELGEAKQIVIQSFKDLVSVKTVGASFEEYGGSRGLLGEFGSGQWLARNGTVVLDSDAFGNEWQVLETEPKLFQAKNRYPQHPVQCIMPSGAEVGRRRLGASIAHAAAEKACEHWGDLKDQCVYDVMATGDLELADAGAF